MQTAILLMALAIAGPEDDARAAIAIALALAEAEAKQAQPAPKIDDPPAFPSYADATRQALNETKPLVTFIGTEPRKVPGAIVTGVDALRGFPSQCVVVSAPKGDGELHWKEPLKGNPTDAQIRQALIGGEPAASPFVPKSGKSDKQQVKPTADDDGPWLSVRETENIKARWPKGLAFPANLKFYRLEPVYQNLWTQNGGRFKGWRADPVSDYESREFMVSGGMKDIDVRKWRSVKGLAIPPGKTVSVWNEDTDVKAFALVPRHRWRFDPDIVAYDVLFKVDDEDLTIFEVRTQKKGETGWSTGEVAFTDDKVAPLGFHGAGQSCASCHNHANGELVSVPGQIYLTGRWGDDGRFSWRPFKLDGSLDMRWPLKILAGTPTTVSTATQADEGTMYGMASYGGNPGMMQGGTRRGMFGRKR